jgi:epoxyqueuosine reductase
MMEDIFLQMEERGYAIRAIPVERLDDLRVNIESGHRNGLFAEELYKEYLSSFVFIPPENMRSVIVTAVKQPQVSLTFTWKGVTSAVIVPPTYLHGAETDRKALSSLIEALEPGGYRALPAILPRKLLAVHSGLAAYGRNNITYVAGMGSFHRLAAFYSDIPPEDGSWHELKVMERCDDCGSCLSACPAGAISPERFLLRADRCIVFHNEHPSEIPFPAWIDPSWHNCLVGCMLCQEACPENGPYLKNIVDGPVFTEDDTSLLLAGTPSGGLPGSTVKKLADSDLLGSMEVIPRNLRALLA